jgi:Tfp pilus assembly protein PilP
MVWRLTIAFMLVAGTTATAQSVPAASTKAVATPPAATVQADAAAVADLTVPQVPALEPQGFTYEAQGRRDPFISLMRRGTDPENGVSPRPPGLPGLAVSEVALKGTVNTPSGFVAILQGVDSKAYVVREGEKLFDGSVRHIAQDSIILTQQISDQFSREKFREVRKGLRQTDEAK